MSRAPRSDDFMDDLFGAMGSGPLDPDDQAVEDAAMHAVLARLGVEADAVVPLPSSTSPTASQTRGWALIAALAAALVLGVFLGRSLPSDTEDPVATVAGSGAPASSVFLTAPPSRAGQVDAAPDAPLPAQVAPVQAAPAQVPSPPVRILPPAVAIVETPPGPVSPPAEATDPVPERVRVAASEAGPGLDLDASATLYIEGRTGVLRRGSLTFLREGGVHPSIDLVHFPELGLYALPVGTVFAASAARDLALVTVMRGEVHLVHEDGRRLGSVRAGESVAVGPSDGGLRLVSIDGVDAGGLAVLLPEVSADEREIQHALVAMRLRSVQPDLIRDLRGLEDLDE